MARTYTLKRRAEQQADTRRRIVEAAVDLHTRIGPAATSFSMVAEQAGVQRHTLYAHFPDERSLLMACSGWAMERSPLPDAAPWRDIADRSERLRTGIAAVYGWFEHNAEMAACVLRDAEASPLVREIVQMRMGPQFGAYHETLGASLNQKQRAVLHVALNFHTWRALVRDCGLKPAVAVRTMVQAIEGAGTA
jgi:AcrR family transcriptional regulator